MKTQSGRSMIEMLGVLAIIGVLSIGGLAGYTRAMNAHQANQVLDYVNRCSIAVQERIGVAPGTAINNVNCDTAEYLGTSDTLPGAANNGHAVIAYTANASTFTITATLSSSDVAAAARNKGTGQTNPAWSGSNTSVVGTYTL